MIKIPFKKERQNPRFEDDYIRYPEALVRHFLKEYTKAGDKVFDPFTGLGTTLFVAEEMKRKAFGIEANDQRYEWVAGQLKNWQQLAYGDSAKLISGFPKMDFCMTSPPFMARHQKWNPLCAGNPKHAGYDKYLKQMARIFKSLHGIMKKGAHVVVQVDNLKHGKIFTPLVRDMSALVAKSFTQIDEVIVEWQKPKADYLHTHCLVFKNT